MKKALFLDRDGTLNVDSGYLGKPEDIVLLPYARAFVQKALQTGWMLFLFTNQSGVARGYYPLSAVEACNQQLIELLDPEAVFRPLFSGICVATEHPDEPAVYRKPSPRFITESIALHRLDPRQCWMAGDRLSDWQAGVHAGVRVAALETGKPIDTRDEAFLAHNAIPRVADLGHFARWLAITLQG